MPRAITSGLILSVTERRQLKIVPITTKGKISGALKNPKDMAELGMLVTRTTTKSHRARKIRTGAVPALAASIAVTKSFFMPLPIVLFASYGWEIQVVELMSRIWLA